MASASGEFDAYFVFLGIPPEQQPPSLYRLLDVRDFEDDKDIIDRGYERRMAYLHSIKSGDHVEAAEDLKSELARARLCLLNVKKKERYDENLSAKQAGPSSVEAASPERASGVDAGTPRDVVEPEMQASTTGPLGSGATAVVDEVGTGGGKVACPCGVDNFYETIDRGQQIHCCSCGAAIDVPIA